MALHTIRQLTLPNGDVCSVSGIQTCFCNSSASQQTKDITVYDADTNGPSYRFTVKVCFENAQEYNGVPYLMVTVREWNSSRMSGYYSSMPIYRNYTTPAGYGEWKAGEILDLTYMVLEIYREDIGEYEIIEAWVITNGESNYFASNFNNNVATVAEVKNYLGIT